MEKTIKEIEELSLQKKTGTKLDYLLKNAKDDEPIPINITLHARQWRQVLFILAYYSSKGSRGYGSLSSTVWHIIERAYKGLLNAISKKAKEETGKEAKEEPKTAPKPASGDDDEGEGSGGDNPGFDFI